MFSVFDHASAVHVSTMRNTEANRPYIFLLNSFIQQYLLIYARQMPSKTNNNKEKGVILL